MLKSINPKELQRARISAVMEREGGEERGGGGERESSAWRTKGLIGPGGRVMSV